MRLDGLWVPCTFTLYKSFLLLAMFCNTQTYNKMASFHIQYSFLVLVLAMVITLMNPTNATLSPHFYDKVCPQALPVIKSVVQRAIIRERRIGASLLRLHFHDCFVNVSYY